MEGPSQCPERTRHDRGAGSVFLALVRQSIVGVNVINVKPMIAKHLIFNSLVRKWLDKGAIIAFFVLLSSILVTIALSTLAFEPEIGCWAHTDIGTYSVSCKGVPFAEMVSAVVGIFVNLWVLSIIFPMLLVDSFISHPTNEWIFMDVLRLVGIQMGLLILDGLALLYLFQLIMRGWRRVRAGNK